MSFKMAVDLANPRTWAASLLPSVFACVYCVYKGYAFAFWQMLCFVAVAVLMQSSVNCFNDYADYIKGADSSEDNLTRDDAVLIYENIDPGSVKRLGLVFLIAAAPPGVLLVIFSHSLLPLWIGLAGALTVVVYSFGSIPVSYLPIGELVSGFVMGGLIPLGGVVSATGNFSPEVLLYSLPFILSIALILLSNNGCDIEKDIMSGRKTLAVLLGREKSRRLYRALTLIWLFSALLLPLLLIGVRGLFCCAVLAHILARRPVLWLLSSPLDQEHRIEQMGTVIKANYLLNGAYIVTLALGAALKLW